MSETARIVDELNREHSGDPWHGTPLVQLLDGVDHAQASARPFAGGHTIWEIVLHVTGWKNEVRRRLSGAPAAEPEGGDWPAPSAATAANWRAALERLEQAHRELAGAVAAMPEAALLEPSNDPRDRESGAGVSFYVLLHGIVQHDVYHAGQIALLKKAVPAR